MTPGIKVCKKTMRKSTNHLEQWEMQQAHIRVPDDKEVEKNSRGAYSSPLIYRCAGSGAGM